MASKAKKKDHGHEHHDRVEPAADARVVPGSGRDAAEWMLPVERGAHFVRSGRGHADIGSVDPAAALKGPGVKAVLTGEGAVHANFRQAPKALTSPAKSGRKALAPD